MARPAWVKPGAIAFHTPSAVAFVVASCRRDKAKIQCLWSAPKGKKGSCYPLEECRVAELTDFKAASLLVVGNRAYTIDATPQGYRIKGDKQVCWVRLKTQQELDFDAAVASFAEVFDGVIVPNERGDDDARN